MPRGELAHVQYAQPRYRGSDLLKKTFCGDCHFQRERSQRCARALHALHEQSGPLALYVQIFWVNILNKHLHHHIFEQTPAILRSAESAQVRSYPALEPHAEQDQALGPSPAPQLLLL